MCICLSDFLMGATVLHIETGNRALATNFFARQGMQQTIPNTATTTIQFDVEDFDTGGYFDNITYVYQPLVAGVYQFVLQLAATPPSTTAGRIRAGIAKGTPGSGVTKGISPYILLTNTQIPPVPPVVVNIEMNGTTDKVYAFVQSNAYSGTAMLVNNTPEATYFTGSRLR